MKKSRIYNSFLNASTGMFASVLNTILAFVVRNIFIKTLGIQYLGVSSVFSNILVILSFAELGIGTAMTYTLYKPLADEDNDKIGSLMTFYKKIYVVIAAVIFVAGISLTPFLNYIIKDVPDVVEDLRFIYVLYIINTSSSYLFIYKSLLLTAAQKDYQVARIKILVSIIKTAVECVLLLVFRDFVLYLVFNISMTIVQNVIISNKANTLYPAIKKFKGESISRQEKKSLFADVKALFLYKVSGVVLNGTDNIIISAFVGTVYAGIYGNYILISNQIYSFIYQIFGATTASVGNVVATESKEMQYVVFKRLFFISFVLYCICSSCLWAMFQPFVTIWIGEEFLMQSYTVIAIIVEFYIRGMLSPVSAFRTTNGLFVQGKYRPVIMSVINIVVSVALVNVCGITGVLLGTIISRVSTQLWYDPMLIYKKAFGVKPYKYFIKYFSYSLTTVISGIIITVIKALLRISNAYVEFFVSACLGAIIPVVCIIAFYSKTEEFCYLYELLGKTIKKIIRRGDKKE